MGRDQWPDPRPQTCRVEGCESLSIGAAHGLLPAQNGDPVWLGRCVAHMKAGLRDEITLASFWEAQIAGLTGENDG